MILHDPQEELVSNLVMLIGQCKFFRGSDTCQHAILYLPCLVLLSLRLASDATRLGACLCRMLLIGRIFGIAVLRAWASLVPPTLLFFWSLSRLCLVRPPRKEERQGVEFGQDFVYMFRRPLKQQRLLSLFPSLLDPAGSLFGLLLFGE